MKIQLIALTAALALTSWHADAAVKRHRVSATCTPGFLSCPPAKPAVAPAPIPVPAPVAAATPSTQDIFSGLLNLKDQVLADLQQADATQAAVLNPATSSAWEAAIHICLTGMPTMGTPGQPGYIPGNGGLIGWVQGLTAPSVAAVPPLPDNPSPATKAVHAQILIDAAMYDVNNVVNQINSGGFPKFLETDCGGVLAHIQGNINTIAGQVAVFDALLAKYVMPVVAAAHKGPPAK